MTDKQKPAELADKDLDQISGGGPHVKVFSGADGSQLEGDGEPVDNSRSGYEIHGFINTDDPTD